MQREMLTICVLLLALSIGCKQKDPYKLMQWEVGQWVLYDINGKEVRYAIVGSHDSYFWLERSGFQNGEHLVIKALTLPGSNEIEKFIVKGSNGSPIEFAFDGFPFEYLLLEGDVEILSKENLSLSGYELYAVHLRQKEADIWFSNEIPIFGILKYENGSEKILLKDYGLNGAESEIAEVPKGSAYLNEL